MRVVVLKIFGSKLRAARFFKAFFGDHFHLLVIFLLGSMNE